MYQALYRKYRPKTFADVVGQEHITTTLKNEIATGKNAHAYLFTGSRGTGKTTCSKIVAKALNCPNAEDGNPCGECDVCKGIDNGSILDVVEIDAASNNSVDNIRQLREEANFTPAQVKYRVYIMDETHMLSSGAFNALLKIMEEPPEHVVFILATTEVQKVPATILSRCERFDFKRIPSEVIAGRLEYVAQKENIALSPEAALLIARLSDGGMRDALSLLDVCAAYDSQVTLDTVTKAAGLTGQDHLFEIADAILAQNTGAAINTVGKLRELSVDYERLCEQLITHFRNLMILKSVKEPGDLVVGIPEELEQLKKQAMQFSLSSIISQLDILQETLSRLGKITDRRTEVEMMLVRMCSPSLNLSAASLLSRIDKLESQLRTGAVSGQAVSAVTPKQALQKAQASVDVLPAEEPALTREDIVNQPRPAEKPSEEVSKFLDWGEVLARLETKNPALFGALSKSSAYVKGDLLLIDSQDAFFLKLIRENEYSKQCLKNAIVEITGKKYRLGPFKRDAYQVVNEQEADPIEELLQKAKNAGLQVEIK